MIIDEIKESVDQFKSQTSEGLDARDLAGIAKIHFELDRLVEKVKPAKAEKKARLSSSPDTGVTTL